MAAGGLRTIVVVLLVVVTQCLSSRVVETNVGRFRGEAASDGDYFEFLGIPYGQVNARNPFGVATPQPAVSGTFDANDATIRCPQLVDGIIIGSLDCLTLNIYTPTSSNSLTNLAVMVLFHGGFFQRGNGNKDSFNPRFLVRHNVIIVSVNYRLGPYGFMCLNRRAVPGNQGLKDQYLALKWVKENIRSFGGSPDRVTLFGISTGGHSIDLHLLSKQEKIYNSVIIQSGSSLAATVLYEPDREAPIKMASYLGLDHSSTREALAALSIANPHDVIRAAVNLDMEFKPCAETKFDGVEPFITDYWVNSSVPKAQDLPIMIGFTEHERMLEHIDRTTEEFLGSENLFNDNLNITFDFDEETLSKMVIYTRRFYLGDNAVSRDVYWDFVNYDTDYVYLHPIQRSIKKFVEAGANVYYYMFSYSGGRNAATIANLEMRGAAHGDDIPYLFDNAALAGQNISSQDQLIIDRMTTLWTNFARHRNPTRLTSVLLPVTWPPITNNVYHCLKIDQNLSIEQRPFNRRLAFWDLFYQINEDSQKSFEAAVAADDDDDDDYNGGNRSTFNSSSLLIIVFALSIVAYRH